DYEKDMKLVVKSLNGKNAGMQLPFRMLAVVRHALSSIRPMKRNEAPSGGDYVGKIFQLAELLCKRGQQSARTGADLLVRSCRRLFSGAAVPCAALQPGITTEPRIESVIPHSGPRTL
ncbi:hypothetical protein GOODEAATRI_020965, partial [Goodea atripinnis]